MKKILVIQEQGIIRKEMVQMLASHGCSVDVASDGAEGMEKVKSFEPDCIITTIRLEKVSGLEVIMNVRDQRNETPIIALCKRERFGHCDYEAPARQFGANEVLIRPFRDVELISSIKSLNVAIA